MLLFLLPWRVVVISWKMLRGYQRFSCGGGYRGKGSEVCGVSRWREYGGGGWAVKGGRGFIALGLKVVEWGSW